MRRTKAKKVVKQLIMLCNRMMRVLGNDHLLLRSQEYWLRPTEARNTTFNKFGKISFLF